MNDAKALALLKSGDQEALEWFIDKYSAYVGTVVNSILASSMTHEDVEEVTADVFVTLWRSVENLYPLNLKGYLSRVARSLNAGYAPVLETMEFWISDMVRSLTIPMGDT